MLRVMTRALASVRDLAGVPRGSRDGAGISLTVHIALDGEALPPAAVALVESLHALAALAGGAPAPSGPVPFGEAAAPAGSGGGRGVRPRLVRPAAAAPLRVHLAGRTVYRDGLPVPLTRREFDLLAFLSEHPRQVFSRAQLLRQVWGYPAAGGERTVDVHVRRLRAKLGEADPLISTVRGVGYRLDEASRVTVVAA